MNALLHPEILEALYRAPFRHHNSVVPFTQTWSLAEELPAREASRAGVTFLSVGFVLNSRPSPLPSLPLASLIRMNTDKDTAQVLASIEEALQDGLVSRSELQTLRRQVEALELPFERMAWLRSEVVKLLQAKMPDEHGRTMIAWVDKITRFLPTEPTQPSPSIEQTSQIFFAPGDDCHQALFAALDSATRSLDICVFTITDDQITARIRNAARRRVSVRIITDNDKALDLGSDVHDLSRSGLNVRVDDTIAHMHHKFAIVDGCKVITGSFNWTRGAATNHENLFICCDKKTVASYQQEFNRLWERMFSLG